MIGFQRFIFSREEEAAFDHFVANFERERGTG
jgi:hypothetical protein